MRPSALSKCEFFHARATQNSGEAIVALDAARLVVDSVLLVALHAELLLDRPGPGPHSRVFQRNDVFERGRTSPCPALDQVQVLARALIVGLGTEVRHVDHEGIALPMA